MMKPTVGRIVYYNTSELNKPVAAIITEVFDGQDEENVVSLTIFPPGHIQETRTGVNRGSGIAEWDWMPYQKQKAAEGDHNSESAEPGPETKG